MKKASKISADVAEFLSKKNIDIKNGGAFLADYGKDLLRKDAWVIITDEALTVAEGVSVVRRGESSPISVFECDRFLSIPSKEIKEIICVEEISTVTVSATIEKDGVKEEILLFNASFSVKDDAYDLKELIETRDKDLKLNKSKLKAFTTADEYCTICGRKYADKGRKFCPVCVDKVGLMKRLSVFFIEFKSYIFLIFLTVIITTALGLIAPYASTKIFYDEVLNSEGKYYGMVLGIVGVIAGIRLLSMFANMLNGVITAKVSARVVLSLKMTIFKSINRLSLSFFTGRQTGGLMTQINRDADSIYHFLCDGFPYLITNGIQLVAVLIILFCINPILAVYSFITIPIFFFTYRFLHRLFQKLHIRNFMKSITYSSFVSDIITGMRVVKAFSKEESEEKRFEKLNEESEKCGAEVSIKSGKIYPVLGFILKIGVYVVWAVGGIEVMKGEMNYGDFLAFISYIEMAFSPVQSISNISNWWSNSFTALSRLFEIQDSVSDVPETETPIPLESIKGDVEFENVCFSYSKGRDILKNITFNIKAGETVGIVGKTGAGKSTIANLLIRLYDPDSGTIKIDGIDTKDVSAKDLHSSISIVSQETYLFRGTILENIRYAKPDATDEEVIFAAKAAYAHKFIMAYPDGYETMVGFGHKDLSGGERQRISIARAILTNPKILILDEATAAMDTQTEHQIQTALDKVTKNRTTIIIAHRLSTLKNADKIIVIENGKIAEQGKPAKLLSEKGVYHKLYTLQAEAFRTIGIGE